MGEMVSLTAEDGHKFAAYRAAPKGAPKGGLVIIQEIFGVNHHIRNVTDSFAAEGYVALAPAIFDRAERGFETGYKPEDIELGRGSDDEVLARSERFVRTLTQVTARYQRPLQYADLRHADGYAVKLKGITTSDKPVAGKKRN